MKIFILIMYTSSGPITTQEFNSLASCENAKQVILGGLTGGWTRAACVEK